LPPERPGLRGAVERDPDARRAPARGQRQADVPHHDRQILMGPRALFTSLFCVTLLAACGGPPPAARPEVTPAPSGSGTPVATASGSPAPTPSGTAAAGHPLPDHNTPLQASKLLAGVKQIGVDVHKPLGSLPNAKKKELMNFFVKALGYEDCQGCH